MTIHIRSAVPEDRERIRPLQKEIAELHHEGRPDLFRTEARYFTDETFAQRLSDPNHTVYIAETEDGQVAGYAFAWVIAYREHPTYVDFDVFYIDDICVLKAFQNQGIGKALMTCCREKAQALGCKMMDLGVWAFNQESIAFYRACGFTDRVHRMELRLR